MGQDGVVRAAFLLEALGEDPFPRLFGLRKPPASQGSRPLPPSSKSPVAAGIVTTLHTPLLSSSVFGKQGPRAYIGPPGHPW